MSLTLFAATFQGLTSSENTLTVEMGQMLLVTGNWVWWLSCLGLLLLTLLLLVKHSRPWMIAAAVFLLFSQVTIFIYWDKAAQATLVNLILIMALTVSYHKRKFNMMVEAEIDTLVEGITNNKIIVTKQSLQYLPQIVQKWLIRSNVIGKPMAHSVYLKQKGMMRLKPDGNWLSMRAEQFINAQTPGFIWNAVIDSGFLIPIHGRDKYFHGHGNMLIKAMYSLPIADSTGDEIDQGVLMRFLAEIVWFPTAGLCDYIRWEYVSETSARAIINYGSTTASGIFNFATDGDIKGFEGMRYRDSDNHYSLEKWSIAIKEYKEFNGLRIGHKSEVTWKLASGDFMWLAVELTDIEFNYSRAIAESSANSFEIQSYSNAIVGKTGSG
jgi:hypothetical protein